MKKSQVLHAGLLLVFQYRTLMSPADLQGPVVCLFSVVLQAELFGLEVGQNKHSHHDHNVEWNGNELRMMLRDDVSRALL